MSSHSPLKIYYISGLGADDRIFRHIRVPQPHQLVYLPWIKPLPGESLPQYALRQAAPIPSNEPFALMGLSLGGMIAVEIAKARPAEKVILISSIPFSECMPPYYKWAGALRLHRIIPVSMIQHFSWLKRFFTRETPEDKTMLRRMINDLDPKLVKWAMDASLRWNNSFKPKDTYQIHGSADAILPIRFTKPDKVVKGGGHLMILTRAPEINRWLAELFKTADP